MLDYLNLASQAPWKYK